MSRSTRYSGWLAGLMVVSVLSGVAMGEVKMGTIDVVVTEAGGDAPLPCRAWVDVGGKRLYDPEGDDCIPYGKDSSFSCMGRFRIQVPAGKAAVHVERGKEYLPVDREVEVKADEVTSLSVELRRWVHMADQGWYSSDMHVHFGADNIEVLKQLAMADDVNWVPAFTYWNDFHEKWPEWPTGREVSADATYIVTLANEEIERIGGEPFHSVGALFVFGLDRPIFVPRHDHQYPCDAALARIAKETTPTCTIDTDKPTWGENVVTMAMGLFDSVQVCHNHYHRKHDMPMCCGMAGMEIEESREGWGEEELFVRTNSIYYRWLNCGFKLAVSGGSAMGVMPVPLGYCRTYANVEGELTEASYLDAIRKGRTFATSGPMLWMTADGKGLGETIAWSSDRDMPLRVRVSVRSIDRLESLELVQNGEVVGYADLSRARPKPVFEGIMRRSLNVTRSGWVAARAVYRAETGRLRQAHTSPIYITVDDKPTAGRRDAEYMLRWIDKLMEVSETPGRYRFASDRAESQAMFAEARKVYERIATTATEVWGD